MSDVQVIEQGGERGSVMKWSFFKKGRTRGRKHWLASAGQRVTGVAPQIPDELRTPLMVAGGFAGAALCVGGMWVAINIFYFQSPLFVLHNLRENVTITTGKTLTPEVVCDFFGIEEGVNLLSIPIDRKRRELLKIAPHIRDVKISRQLPDKLSITITERDPIALIKAASGMQVVDEEGVVFIRKEGTTGLPLIQGTDGIEPGDRLRDNNMAAVRLIDNSLRPDCRVRLQIVDTAKPDYLTLIFADDREAKFAWPDMRNSRKDSKEEMQGRLDALARSMNNEIGIHIKKWDARLPRIIALRD